MRILLVQPKPPEDYIGFHRTAVPEPLALESVAAMALPRHEVRILDLRIEKGDALPEMMETFRPEMVGVTCLTTEVYAAQDLLKRVRAEWPEVITLVGGLHATLLPEDFQLPYVDVIVMGEGETTFSELTDALALATPSTRGDAFRKILGLAWRHDADQWTVNSPRPLLPSLDVLPIPARALASKYHPDYFFLFDQPHTVMATSRGCPFKCSFCSVWKFYRKKCRYMSAERVVDEMETVPTRTVSMLDDNFLANVPRAWKIVELIRQRGLKKEFGVQGRTDTISKNPDLIKALREVGLETILIGFEGSTQQKLDAVSKGATIEQNEKTMDILNSLGVLMWGAFIVDPDWTHEDFQELKRYREAKEIIYPQFTILTPLPGTDLYSEKYNQLVTHDYRLFDALHAVLPTRLPRAEFYKEFSGLYRPDNPALLYDWISSGRITMDRARKARKLLMEMSDYDNFLKGERVAGLV